MALKLTPYQHFSAVAMLVGIAVFLFKKHLVLVPPSADRPKRKKFFSKPEGILFQLGVIGFCSMATEGAMFDWSSIYFKEVVVVPAMLVPLGYASFMIMMASGRFVADRLIARLAGKSCSS